MARSAATGSRSSSAYFLATFIVRQLTGCWAFYEMNFEVRNGTLAMRLLRPVHPLWAYAFENIAPSPMRIARVAPGRAVALVGGRRHAVTHDPVHVGLLARVDPPARGSSRYSSTSPSGARRSSSRAA
jgi:hypothetical protein